MKANTYMLLFIVAAVFFAASCSETAEYLPSPQPDEDIRYQTTPFSITVGITPMTDKIADVELKTTFKEGDIIEITNSKILAEPAILTSNGCEGKDKATFTGTLKVKLGQTLTSGTTTLTAALKNTDSTLHLYNDGRPFVDVKEINSYKEGLEKYSYWAYENFTYNGDATAINLEQKTVFAELTNFAEGTIVEMTLDNGFGNEQLDKSTTLFALPFGINCIGTTMDKKGKHFYKISGVPKDCIPGVFTIGKGKQVYFSKGNLQYRPSVGEWRLAPKQYHTCNYTGVYFGSISDFLDTDIWVDIFNGDYWIDELDRKEIDSYGNLLGKCVYGAEWDVLSYYEWDYLLHRRENAENKFGHANVGGNDGIVILPDDWNLPTNIKEKYTAIEWQEMESAGAVFLPRTGLYSEGMVNVEMDDLLRYWSKTKGNIPVKNCQVVLTTDLPCVFFPGDERQDLCPIRLVYRMDDIDDDSSTQEVDYCFSLEYTPIWDPSNFGVSSFCIFTDNYYKGQYYEISMSVKSQYGCYCPYISICDELDGYENGDGIIVEDFVPFDYTEWTVLHTNGSFNSDGSYLVLRIVEDDATMYNKIYIDNICIKIDGIEVVKSNCSSLQTNFAWKMDVAEYYSPIDVIDKEYIMPYNIWW